MFSSLVLTITTSMFLFISFSTHILSTLIVIEYFVVCLFMGLVYLVVSLFSDSSFMLVYLVTSVCSSVMGVSILIKTVRSLGVDSFSLSSIALQ